MPVIKRMAYMLNRNKDGSQYIHPPGTLYKGVGEGMNPKSLLLLKQAEQTGSVIRFPQFQSSSVKLEVADKFKCGDGFLFTIIIQEEFWGARRIGDLSFYGDGEQETLFPPYSAFTVESVNDKGATLIAQDKYCDIDMGCIEQLRDAAPEPDRLNGLFILEYQYQGVTGTDLVVFSFQRPDEHDDDSETETAVSFKGYGFTTTGQIDHEQLTTKSGYAALTVEKRQYNIEGELLEADDSMGIEFVTTKSDEVEGLKFTGVVEPQAEAFQGDMVYPDGSSGSFTLFPVPDQAQFGS